MCSHNHKPPTIFKLSLILYVPSVEAIKVPEELPMTSMLFQSSISGVPIELTGKQVHATIQPKYSPILLLLSYFPFLYRILLKFLVPHLHGPKQ